MAVLLPNMFEPDKFVRVDIKSIVDIIQKGQYKVCGKELKYFIQELQKMDNPQTRKSMKLKLPCFNLGEFQNRIVSDNFVSAQYFIYDIDNISSPEKMQEIKDKLRDYALFYFVSPSGNGLKFAIVLRREIESVQEFKYNYRTHLDFFAHHLELHKPDPYSAKKKVQPKEDIIDSQCEDVRRAPFFSYDPDMFVNYDAKEFPVYDAPTLTESNVISTLCYNKNHEVNEICAYISNYRMKLTYQEWTLAGMAIYHEFGEDGFVYWKMIPPSESYQGLNEDQLKRKYKSFKSNNNITISSLYYLAINKGFSQKKAVGADLISIKEMFKSNFFFNEIYFDKSSGWLFPTTKKNQPVLCFSFKSFLPEGILTLDNGEKEDMYYVNEELMSIRNEDISSVMTFKSNFLKKRKTDKIFLIPSHDVAYARLFEYIAKSKADRQYLKVKGLGNVYEGVWNLGNICIYNGHIRPFDKVLYASDKICLLEEYDCLSININKDNMQKALSAMAKFYPYDLPTILGWAVCQTFYKLLKENQLKIPILFMHGESGTGKSELAKAILAIYGVQRNADVNKFMTSLSGESTFNAINNLRDNLFSIPMFFDEYRDLHYEKMKGYFDMISAVKAVKSQDNRIYEKKVSSGTMLGAVNISNQPELINRCAYVRMKKPTQETSIAFQNEFTPMLKYLSSFLIEIVNKYHYEDFMENYHKNLKYLRDLKATKSSRVIESYAMVKAGWDFAKEYMPGYKSIDNYDNKIYSEPEYWIRKLEFVKDRTAESSLPEKIVSLLCRMAADKYYQDKYFKIEKTDMEYEGRDYWMLTFVFSEQLWQVIREVDNKGSRNLQFINRQEVRDAFKYSYPEQLKKLDTSIRVDKKIVRGWKLWVPVSELMSMHDYENTDLPI